MQKKGNTGKKPTLQNVELAFYTWIKKGKPILYFFYKFRF